MVPRIVLSMAPRASESVPRHKCFPSSRRAGCLSHLALYQVQHSRHDAPRCRYVASSDHPLRRPSTVTSTDEISPSTGNPKTAGASPKRHRQGLAIVFGIVFLDLLGFGIILPFLPYYASVLGASGLGLGLLFTSYSLAQLLGAAFLGRASDRWGRRPVLLLSLAGSAIGMVLSGLATALWALCLARAIAGLFGGSIAIAQAYVADVTEPEERPKFMGFVGACIGLGFLFGPAMGVLFKSLGQGFREVAFAAAGLAAVNLLWGLWRLPETSHHHRAASGYSMAAWASAFGEPRLLRVLTARFLVMFAFVGMETTFAYLGEALYGLDEFSFGLVLTFLALVLVIVQGGLIGPLTRFLGGQNVAVLGAVLMAGSLVLLPFCPTLLLAMVVMAVLAASQGLLTPTLTALTSQLADQDEQGTVLGVGQSLAAAARASGPLVAGGLYDLSIQAPYLLGAGMAMLAAALLMTIRRG